jgi:uncharacterized membrane protein YsdA (DUF1294 family)
MTMKKFLWVLAIVFTLTVLVGDYASAQQTQTKQKTRTGWSKKKKGAVIGGAAGAATGVAVSKNDSKGAIIGGAVGAGAGYLYGRHKDKKNPTKKTVHKTKTVVE